MHRAKPDNYLGMAASVTISDWCVTHSRLITTFRISPRVHHRQ